jgi:citrate lyase subunit beta/citryl-CoA lyase
MQTVGAHVAETTVTRSYLFVPGDSEKKLQKAASSAADAVIVDLEDSVAASARPHARELARDFLQSNRDLRVWIRINPMGTADAEADLQAVMPASPTGIVVPKPRHPSDIVGLARILERLERAHGEERVVESGRTGILPIATEHPQALFHLHEYTGCTSRLGGLAWGAEDLSAAVGAMASRDESGAWLPPYELARSLCLFAASAVGVPAIDTVYTDFRDDKGLAAYAARARRDGFAGMLAIHPAQVDIINDAFSPSDAEVERARRIVALFEANPDSGTLGMDGRMLDRPHWVQAQRILEIAEPRSKAGQ